MVEYHGTRPGALRSAVRPPPVPHRPPARSGTFWGVARRAALPCYGYFLKARISCLLRTSRSIPVPPRRVEARHGEYCNEALSRDNSTLLVTTRLAQDGKLPDRSRDTAQVWGRLQNRSTGPCPSPPTYRLDLATRSSSSFFLIAYEFEDPLAALMISSARHSDTLHSLAGTGGGAGRTT